MRIFKRTAIVLASAITFVLSYNSVAHKMPWNAPGWALPADVLNDMHHGATFETMPEGYVREGDWTEHTLPRTQSVSQEHHIERERYFEQKRSRSDANNR